MESPKRHARGGKISKVIKMKVIISFVAVSCTVVLILMLPGISAHCQDASAAVANEVNVAENINTSIRGEALNYHVNTPYRENGPLVTHDGKRLYFSREGYPDNTGGARDEDIWYSEFNDSTQRWSKAINIGPPLNNDGPNFITGFIGNSSDSILLGNVYRKRGRMNAGMSVSVRTGDLWSFPAPVRIMDDYDLSDRVSYDLSDDRTVLIIAEEKDDSRGKLDLYVSFRDPDDKTKMDESVNLGSTINSFGNETEPWLAHDGRTLYFSSDGLNGYGKLDLFMSKRLDDTWLKWSEPVNLGPGINSPFDDVSFYYSPHSRYAFYARGLSEENDDIFQVDLTHLFTGGFEDAPEIGQTKIVENVFADDRSEIRKEAVADLQNIVAYLRKNESVVMTVTAHSNVHGTRSESIELSNQRASNVVDFLARNGIDKQRLSYKGEGHDIVVNTKESIEQIEIDSSVEFRIVTY